MADIKLGKYIYVFAQAIHWRSQNAMHYIWYIMANWSYLILKITYTSKLACSVLVSTVNFTVYGCSQKTMRANEFNRELMADVNETLALSPRNYRYVRLVTHYSLCHLDLVSLFALKMIIFVNWDWLRTIIRSSKIYLFYPSWCSWDQHNLAIVIYMPWPEAIQCELKSLFRTLQEKYTYALF